MVLGRCLVFEYLDPEGASRLSQVTVCLTRNNATEYSDLSNDWFGTFALKTSSMCVSFWKEYVRWMGFLELSAMTLAPRAVPCLNS